MFRNMLKFPMVMYPVFMHFVCWLNDGSYLPVMHPYAYGGDVDTERMLFGSSDEDDSIGGPRFGRWSNEREVAAGVLGERTSFDAASVEDEEEAVEEAEEEEEGD